MFNVGIRSCLHLPVIFSPSLISVAVIKHYDLGFYFILCFQAIAVPGGKTEQGLKHEHETETTEECCLHS